MSSEIKKPERVIVSVFIAKDVQDSLLKIAARKELKFSDVVRAAIKEYITKENE